VTVVNIPNVLTFLRALGVPVFLYLFLVVNAPLAAFFIIAIAGLTDYLDGKLARALNQSTDFGAKFDPVVDRLYITAVVVAFAVKEYLPWHLVVAIIARDLLMSLLVAYQKVRRREQSEVSFLGKAATFNLLYAFPFLLLKDLAVIGQASFIVGWSFAIWGISLYLYTALQYFYAALRKTR
jgi:cardiolipin synthase